MSNSEPPQATAARMIVRAVIDELCAIGAAVIAKAPFVEASDAKAATKFIDAARKAIRERSTADG